MVNGKQINYCVSLIRRRKKNYTDSKKVWKSSFCSQDIYVFIMTFGHVEKSV